MPRDSNGTYTLPSGNPVVSGTTIASSWANTTLSDVGTALTGSLSRAGEGGMTGQFKADAGTIGAPGISWGTETTSGWYRASAGNFRFAISGADIVTVTAAGISAAISASSLAVSGNATIGGTLGVTGAVTANAGVSSTTGFSGPGSSLTALNATQLTSGTVPDARFPATLPAVSGANLTNLNATNISSGTLADGRLSSNVPLKNASNTFTAAQTISGVGDGFRLVAPAATPARFAVAGNAGTPYTNSFDMIQDSAGVGYLLNRANAGLEVWTNSVARGTISAAGNWTINAPSSGITLVVNRESGQVNTEFTDGTVTSAYYSSGASTRANFGTTSNHPLTILTNNTARITVGSGGGVQIGAPTGGDQGAATLNVDGGIFQDGQQIGLTGTYTPTLTNVNNVSSSTAAVCNYTRIGAMVMVTGGASVTVGSAASEFQLGISLPIASNFGATTDASGSAGALNGSVIGTTGGGSGTINADTVNDRLNLNGGQANLIGSWSFACLYRVI